MKSFDSLSGAAQTLDPFPQTLATLFFPRVVAGRTLLYGLGRHSRRDTAALTPREWRGGGRDSRRRDSLSRRVSR